MPSQFGWWAWFTQRQRVWLGNQWRFSACVCVCCVCILHSEKQLLLPILVCGCVRNFKKHLPAPITVCLENLIVSTKHTHMHLPTAPGLP